jgi:hypothetical protein
MLVAAAPAAAALEPDDSANLLDHPRVDVAVLDATGPGGIPRLLVVDPLEPGSTDVRLAILERDGPWRVVSELLVGLDGDPGAEVETPWLVDLEDDRFALVISAPGGPTVIQALRVRVDGERPQIQARAATSLAEHVDFAGLADVFGDDRPELVVAASDTGDQPGCEGGTQLRVLDRITLLEQRAVSTPGLRLGGGVLGRWSGSAGADAGTEDLLAYASNTSPDEDEEDRDLRLVEHDLTIGRIFDDRPPATAQTPQSISSPMRI